MLFAILRDSTHGRPAPFARSLKLKIAAVNADTREGGAVGFGGAKAAAGPAVCWQGARPMDLGQRRWHQRVRRHLGLRQAGRVRSIDCVRSMTVFDP